MTTDPTPARSLLEAARFVATHWRDAAMASETLRQTGMSHPLALVLAALDGETDPAELGITEESWPDFRAALRRADAATPDGATVEGLWHAMTDNHDIVIDGALLMCTCSPVWFTDWSEAAAHIERAILAALPAPRPPEPEFAAGADAHAVTYQKGWEAGHNAPRPPEPEQEHRERHPECFRPPEPDRTSAPNQAQPSPNQSDRTASLVDKANAWRASGMLTDGEWRAVMAVLHVEDIRAMSEDEYAAILATPEPAPVADGERCAFPDCDDLLASSHHGYDAECLHDGRTECHPFTPPTAPDGAP